jgi:hypothetical protein
MQNLGILRQLSLGDLSDDGKRRERERRREEEKIMPSLMATSLRWRTHSARTNFTSYYYVLLLQSNIGHNKGSKDVLL